MHLFNPIGLLGTVNFPSFFFSFFSDLLLNPSSDILIGYCAFQLWNFYLIAFHNFSLIIFSIWWGIILLFSSSFIHGLLQLFEVGLKPMFESSIWALLLLTYFLFSYLWIIYLWIYELFLCMPHDFCWKLGILSILIELWISESSPSPELAVAVFFCLL